MISSSYQHLKDRLKRQILSGVYREGDVLPSENTLARVNNLTRTTVRKALNALASEGYIEKRQGRGSIVRRRTLGLLSFRGFSEVLENDRHRISTQVFVPPRHIDWPKNFFFTLSEAERASGCIYLKRLRGVEDTPVMLERTYVPNFSLEGLFREPFIENSLFRTLNRRFQIEIKSVEQEIRAIPADGEAESLLQVKPGAPLLQIFRRYFTGREGLHVYSSLICNTEKYTIGATFD